MSKEFEDIAASSQLSLQPAAPNAEPGANGPSTAEGAPDAPPSAIEAHAGAPRPPEPAPGAPAACPKCAAPVPPGSPRCPNCGIWQRNNTASLVHGLRSAKLAKQVDAYRVGLIEQLFAERGGRDALDVVSRIAIENYALVCAQHKTIEARLDQDGLFTQTGRRRSAFDMLKSISETIDRLRAALPPIPARTPDTFAGVGAMPQSALELARDLLQCQADGDTLSDFERGQLHVLNAAMRGELLLRGELIDEDPTEVTTDSAPPTEGPLTEAHERPAALEPTCPFGCGTLTRCAELKATNLDAWRTLHWLDESEIERRAREATQEMHESLLRRARGGDFPTW